MKSAFSVLFLASCIYIHAQSLNNIRKESYQTLVFKTDAVHAEKFIKKYDIDINEFAEQTPFCVFENGKVNIDSLPIGHYVLCTIKDSMIEASLVNSTDLIIYPINNQKRIQLEVKNKKGNFISNAKVYLNNKICRANTDAGNYWISSNKPEDKLIKVCTDNDTTFLMLTEKNNWNTKSIFQQHWNIFKRTNTCKVLLWLPDKIANLFTVNKRYHYSNKSIGTKGLMVFNQPKYRLRDTVKMKAYLFDKHNKIYKKETEVYLEYYHPSKGNISQKLSSLKPTDHGSFVFDFVLSDTLINDVYYRVVLKNADKKILLQNSFSTEDYLLDEVATYNLKAEKKIYYPNDSLRFFVNAKDANGLHLLDGKAKLIITTQRIENFFADRVQVPDTILVQEKKLVTEGDTKFSFSTDILPNVNLSIKATVIFSNSNNEIQERNEFLEYKFYSKELVAKIEADTVYADVLINGKSVPASGTIKFKNDLNDKEHSIRFPFKIKIDPFTSSYFFKWKEKDSVIDYSSVQVNEWYNITLSPISKQDTLGFVLNNPYKIPVNYSLFKNNQLLLTAKSDKKFIEWKSNSLDKKQIYTVKYQYIWCGEERTRQENIGLMYKLLSIQINGNRNVFPGQKDSLTIEAKDYKNNAVEDVNITAFSYNSQFKNTRAVPDPPYLQKYKLKPQILHKLFEREDAYVSKQYSLGNYKDFIKKFGVDSMLYYQILFRADSLKEIPTKIETYYPQVSVHVIKNGVPQKIYMLYLNNRLVYYYNATASAPYSFETMHGYSKIAFRLFNKYVEIDSVYLQPFYKHDLFFDIDKLPDHSRISEADTYLSASEKNALENSLFQLEIDYKTRNSFLWQGSRVAFTGSMQNSIVQPFQRGDSIHLFAPGRFDIHFIFEPTYRYKISEKILRLEKNLLFPDTNRYYLQVNNKTSFDLGDTIIEHPAINYVQADYVNKFIKVDDYSPYQKNVLQQSGAVQFQFKKDTSFKYFILQSLTDEKRVVRNFANRINQIPVGLYRMFLVMQDLTVIESDSFEIKTAYTNCIRIDKFNFISSVPFINELHEESIYHPKESIPPVTEIINYYKEPPQNGKSSIAGKVTDAQGKLAVAGASVVIKGTKTGTTTNDKGEFVFKNIKSGKYTLVVTAIGYLSNEVTVVTTDNVITETQIVLKVTNQHLEEVVVIGYGTAMKKDLTGSVTVINNKSLFADSVKFSADKLLTGRVAGLSISPGANSEIKIRGLSSGLSANNPVYIIDGILYDEMPKNISPDLIDKIEVLKGADATSLYGAKGANGVVVISTKSKFTREKFSDYAFWKPELITDKNGQVKFVVTYPDNITSWQTYVLAMDKKLRIGKTAMLTQSYKPVMAQLSVPQFLVEGDTATFIGKSLNYTNREYQIKTSFTIGGNILKTENNLLQSNASIISPQSYSVRGIDTVKALFNLQTSTGFKDGEERKIPVYKKGSEESVGSFKLLNRDTIVDFTALRNAEPLQFSADNKTLDLMLREIKHVKDYPYYCMEQTASKLRMLLIERTIKEALKQKFDDEKLIKPLVEKLQKAQLYEGGWAWWEKGNSDLYITNYIINVLLPLRSDALIEANVRNGLLFLQNNLNTKNKSLLFTILNTMANAGHSIDFIPYINKINYDSLSLHDKWQWISVQQKIKGKYQAQLKNLINEHKETMLGGMYWGNENYLWYSNTSATTVLAYNVLKNETEYKDLLPHISQYFFEMRVNGYWRNTVESAGILSAILPDVMAANNKTVQPTVLKISGDTSFIVQNFPFTTVFGNRIKKVNVEKSGGGITYVSTYQKWFNKTPDVVNDKFEIKTKFEKNNSTQQFLVAGEKINMIVDIDVKKDADYVMLNIPIPAGCTYATKNQDRWNMHKEFFKDRVVMFAEKLVAGKYIFEVELEPRYTGKYVLNPAKAELMYFPIFFGRNELKVVEIK